MSQHIRILQNFKKQNEGQLIAAAGAAIKGLTGNAVFANPPVDLKAVQTAVDDLNAAIAAQAQGGTGATAHKNNKREELTAILRKLVHYVQDNCGGDVATVLNAGFAVATSSRASSPLEKPGIASIDFGNTTQLVVKVNPVARARCYEVQTAAIGAGGAPNPWQNAGLFTNSRAITLAGLTPGTTYSVQVRAVGGSTGTTDWSDPVSHVCV